MVRLNGSRRVLRALGQLFARLRVPEYKSKRQGCAGTGNRGCCLLVH